MLCGEWPLLFCSFCIVVFKSPLVCFCPPLSCLIEKTSSMTSNTFCIISSIQCVYFDDVRNYCAKFFFGGTFYLFSLTARQCRVSFSFFLRLTTCHSVRVQCIVAWMYRVQYTIQHQHTKSLWLLRWWWKTYDLAVPVALNEYIYTVDIDSLFFAYWSWISSLLEIFHRLFCQAIYLHVKNERRPNQHNVVHMCVLLLFSSFCFVVSLWCCARVHV